MHHPSSSDQDLDVLFHANDIDIGYSVCEQCNQDCQASPKCALCRPCRTPKQSADLKVLQFVITAFSQQGFWSLGAH